MFNFYDDNSTGFVEIYNNDFNSAERVINQVKKSKDEEQDNEETGSEEINMKKKKQTCQEAENAQ